MFGGACCQCCKDRYDVWAEQVAEGIDEDQAVQNLKQMSMQKHGKDFCEAADCKLWWKYGADAEPHVIALIAEWDAIWG